MSDDKKDDEVSRRKDDHENIINHIYVNHISQLEKDMIGIKKEQEFQGRDISTLKSMMHDSIEKMATIGAKVNQIWWMFIGAGTVLAIAFAIVKFVVPLLGTGAP